VNLLLFEARELDPEHILTLRDRRLAHLRGVLGCAVGDRLRVGQIDGQRGHAVVEAIDDSAARLRVTLGDDPPPALPLAVVLALPRPKMLRRILRTIAEVGVKELHLINSYRVEKSYWQSPLLAPQSLRDYLLAGLEQAGDTRVPVLELHRRFRPFAEDRLPQLLNGRQGLLADPGASEFYPQDPPAPSVLLIGPEGGFIPFETEFLLRAGCLPRSLGPRILRVETALHCALGRHLENTARVLP